MIGGASQILGQPLRLEVGGALQMRDDVTAANALGDLEPTPDIDRHKGALIEPDIGEGVGEFVAAHVGTALEEG